ncbi:hypothetical protein COO60DRAFT_576641 [Scenedesmus sp. NREL 46B-D3]|nr:hypothetical protein COO60DRAFT_576641 [Scenedesmus sp. NREL 46B-D3]
MQDVVVLNSTYGQIRLKLRPELSPKVVALVKQLASSGRNCHACKFYRHEPIPQGWGQGSFYGPPYALLQGSLAGMAEQPPFEGSPAVRTGDACIIPNTREFFIATADHTEWGHAHTVWGQVADAASWLVIHSMPTEPYTNRTDGAITTRWLTPDVTVPFSISLEQQLQESKLQPS